MPKRKAIQSIDAWLREGDVALEASRAGRIVEGQVNSIQLEPTADQVPVVVTPNPRDLTADPVVTDNELTIAGEVAAPAEVEPATTVAIDEEVAAAWFWDLLAQSGYELW